jgi:hypothetical protein
MRRLVILGPGREVAVGSPVLLQENLSAVLRVIMKGGTRCTFLLRWQNLGSFQDCLLQIEDCAGVKVHIYVSGTLRISDSQRSHSGSRSRMGRRNRIQALFGPCRILLTMGRLAEMQRRLLEVSAKVIPTIADSSKCYFAANDGSRGYGSRAPAPGMARRKSLQKFPVWHMPTYALHEHCAFPSGPF